MSASVATAEELAALQRRFEELEQRLTAAAEPWPEHMCIETAARYVDMTQEALRKLAQRRRIAFSQECKGGRLSFARVDLDEYARTHRIEAKP